MWIMQEVRSHGWWKVESRLEQRSRATHGAVAEENKIKRLNPSYPSLSLKGEGAPTCVDTHASNERVDC